MLAESEPKGGMLPLTELGHGRQGQPNKKGGLKWASSPHVGVEGHMVYHLNDAKCSYPPRGTYTMIIEEWFYNPSKQPSYK